MTDSMVEESFERFVSRPSARRYRELRQALLQQYGSTPDWSELAQLQRALDDGNVRRMLKRSVSLIPRWLLSPRFHFLRGLAARQMEDEKLARRERRCARACLEGLMKTGDGSPRTPYLVTYLTDERDVLCCLGVDIRYQQLVERDLVRCDVYTTHDGMDIWFDVSDLVGQGPRRCAARSRVSQVARLS